MPGPVPGIQEHPSSTVFMGGRDKPGHDDGFDWIQSRSTSKNWVARIKRAMTVVGGVRNRIALALALSLALGVGACGVKNDLVLPDGKPTPKGQKDPSKPPAQQQQGL